MIWAINRENGVYGAKFEESLPCSKSNVSWYDYVELFGELFLGFIKCNSIVHVYNILVHVFNHP